MKDILRVIPTIDVMNVLASYLSASEVEDIMLEMFGRELWIKDDEVKILRDFWREKANESAD